MSLVLVRDKGPVRWLTLNRPAKRNALGPDLVAALGAALAEPGAARLLAITGAGSAFCAGADLEVLQAMQSASEPENLADSRALADLFARIHGHRLPVAAAVNGPALGGGAGLVAACDFAFAAPGAKLGFTEVRIGFVPAIVLNFLLRATDGRTARDLCLTGRLLDAEEAARLGLVTVAEDLEGAVQALGRELAAVSPAAVAHTKQLFRELHGLPLDEGLRRAAEENAKARGTPECREGIRAFLDKRRPKWP